ncbi:hypothetical protein [Methylocystis sp. ATCC 49242]|uniref:rhamnosyltransferase WsaF family glycosyltransferase n=1 Tax=Methylocystis sp. ATCC 49242 TaxID=622637 RepID=UPI0001F868A0|nr:hypothetical protein [Methylocystis sp. ATCC 49242]
MHNRLSVNKLDPAACENISDGQPKECAIGSNPLMPMVAFEADESAARVDPFDAREECNVIGLEPARSQGALGEDELQRQIEILERALITRDEEIERLTRHTVMIDQSVSSMVAGVLSYLMPRRQRKSVNPLFNEPWYFSTYPEIRELGLDPYFHYLRIGGFSGYNPNPLFDSAWYLREYADVRASLINPLEHYYLSGVTEGRDPSPSFGDDPGIPDFFYNSYHRLLSRPDIDPACPLGIIRKEFDKQFYIARYLNAPENRKWRAWPFLHYFYIGARHGYSPNDSFSEEFYVNLYKDVREAIARKEIRSGFWHYLATGKKEGRSCRHKLSEALEWALPGVTQPLLRARAADIEARIKPVTMRKREDGLRKLFVFMPNFNPDIAFGGYRALFELLRGLTRYCEKLNLIIEIVVTAELAANKQYFLWRTEGSHLQELFIDVDVYGLRERSYLSLGPRDRFLCYSSLDAMIASPLAALTDEPRVLALVQEYEPIFHEHSAIYALCSSGFDVPSYPVFNSSALASYFRSHKLGIFKHKANAVEKKDFAVFEHVLNCLPRQSLDSMRARKERLCVVYARPEAHAARNLYEFIEITLKQLCQAGHFGANWRFVGLGCLSPLQPVELGGGHHLEFIEKMPEDEYKRFASTIDLGISLMLAPHPSVVPFELATTGAVVVTNTYDNRPKEFFTAISTNIISVEPTLRGLSAGIIYALEKVENFQSRWNNTYIPKTHTWASLFDETFISSTIARILE